jgi:hypothetical protein
MAIVTTSTAKTVAVYYTGDPAVKLKPKAAEARKLAQVERNMRGRDEAVRPVVEAAALEPFFASADEVTLAPNATAFELRALSWLEYQAAEAMAPEAQIMAHIEHGLASIDGSAERAADFRKAPVAQLVIPLYRAIVETTWGN